MENSERSANKDSRKRKTRTTYPDDEKNSPEAKKGNEKMSDQVTNEQLQLQLNEILQKLTQDKKDMENKLESVQNHIDQTINHKLNPCVEKVDNIDKKVNEIQVCVKDDHERLNILEARANSAEQKVHKNDIIISTLPLLKNDEVSTTVLKVSQLIGLEMCANEFSATVRKVKNKNLSTITVKFNEWNKKVDFLKKFKEARKAESCEILVEKVFNLTAENPLNAKKINVMPRLSAENQRILKYARENAKCFKFTFAAEDGTVLGKLKSSSDDEKLIQLNSINQIKELNLKEETPSQAASVDNMDQE